MKAIISGGGTGGHIFPAIAIANAIRQKWPEAEILFIGAEGRMEMEKVPAAGYKIIGLPIAGLQRRLTLRNIGKNLLLPIKVLRSRAKAKKIIRAFDPDIVVGVGGFASEPTLQSASSMGYPTLLQEQNSYAGLTNKTLSRKAKKICVAYDGMQRYFPADKIVKTGNPVRAEIEEMTTTQEEGCQYFGIETAKTTILVVGGSLGAHSINMMIKDNLSYFKEHDIQVIWQTGKGMGEEARRAVEAAGAARWVKVREFVTEMDKAYAAADIVVSRAGALAISELCIIAKPMILIPYPNAAEDHQTKNAQALVQRGAATMVSDSECATKGIETIAGLLQDTERQAKMSSESSKMGVRKAAEKIVAEIAKIVEAERGKNNK